MTTLTTLTPVCADPQSCTDPGCTSAAHLPDREDTTDTVWGELAEEWWS